MNAKDIIEALRAKYKHPEYTFFDEVRTDIGSYGGIGSIDCIVIGLWGTDSNVYCFEIKVSRRDFLSDIVKFKEKQEFAISNCNMFYFVTPAGLLAVDELPENTGLMEVQNGGRVVIKKIAHRKELETVDVGLLRSISRRVLRSEERRNYDHAIKFLGKEATLSEVDSYVEKILKKKKKDYLDCNIKQGVLDKMEEEKKKIPEYLEVLKIAKMLNVSVRSNNDYLIHKLKQLEEAYSYISSHKNNFIQIAELLKEMDGNPEGK